MALTTYTELQAAITTWLWDREDLAAVIPDFITLCEAQMNRDLDVYEMQAVDNAFTIDSETEALPTGFAGVKSFRLTTNPVAELQYVTPAAMDDILDAAGYVAGKPRFYTVTGTTFVFSPTPDTAYTARLRYRKRLTALSADNAANWLLTAHPDAYLYGALLQSAPYLDEDGRSTTWGALYTKALLAIQGDGDAMVGARPRMRTRAIG